MQKPWYTSTIGRFRTIAICEGISFLVLLFIAMPLKYFAGMPQWVLVVGWIHGMLFISYMICGLDVKRKYSWDNKKTMTAVAASLIPFGPFILDRKILSKEKEELNESDFKS
jgi:integral membrane protein